MDERNMVTVAEAAAALGITPRAVQVRLERGQLRGERVHSRLWLIPRDELARAQAEPLRPGRKPAPA